MAQQPERDQTQPEDFVNLNRMSRDAVAEINAPRQASRKAVSIILQSGQETPDASDCDSGAQRDCEQIACPPFDAQRPLRPFDREQPADQAADHGLAAHQEIRIAPVAKQKPWINKPVEELAANGRARNRRRNHPPTLLCSHRVAETFARLQIDAEADEIRQALEEKVRLGAVTKLQV